MTLQYITDDSLVFLYIIWDVVGYGVCNMPPIRDVPSVSTRDIPRKSQAFPEEEGRHITIYLKKQSTFPEKFESF